MKLDTDICYQALLTHDRRFDGAFFVGVKSTRIYCRTVCTARTPRKESCKFFANAASAEQAGFRPCLRCRPELASGNASVDAVSRIAAVYANRIEDGVLSAISLEELAAQMGISARHLRRVVEAEFGVSPVELAQTHRLLLAKRLLTDTDLPITEIAFASGFSSLRRFNALFKERYALKPSQLRNGARVKLRADSLICELAYIPPFDWDSIISFLSARTWRGVDCVSEGGYMRTAAIGKYRGWFSVSHNPERHSLSVEISTTLAPALSPVLARVKRLFDLSCDPRQIEKHLGSITRGHKGLRVPGAFDGFEVAVRAILGQQITVRAATTLAGRLALALGERIETAHEGLCTLTPSAARIHEAKLSELIEVGIIAARARCIKALAEAVVDGRLVLQPGVDPITGLEHLREIPGIGEWTAQVIAMRVFAWPDAFPNGDLGLKKALSVDNPKRVLELAEKWRPWRAYAAMHLWKSMEKKQ